MIKFHFEYEYKIDILEAPSIINIQRTVFLNHSHGSVLYSEILLHLGCYFEYIQKKETLKINQITLSLHINFNVKGYEKKFDYTRTSTKFFFKEFS